MPMRMVVDPLPKERRPDSSDPPVYDPDGPGGWNRPHGPENWPELVATWRRQGLEERSKVEREAVSSSAILSVGYDPTTMTMEVEFTSGRVYQYFDVSEEEFGALMSAESHGSYLATNIKGRYRYAQM
jgi:KTSC domain-containing protein